MIGSFERGDIYEVDNDLLDESLREIENFQVIHFPGSVLNNKLISQESYHLLTHSNDNKDFGSYILYRVCKETKIRTKSCSKYIFNYNSKYHIKNTDDDQKYYEKHSGLSTTWIIFIIFICFFTVGLLLALWYKRRMNKYYN